MFYANIDFIFIWILILCFGGLTSAIVSYFVEKNDNDQGPPDDTHYA